MIKLGLCSVTFRDKSPSEVVDICKDTGIEAIEWGGDIHLPPGSPAGKVEEIAALCADAGIRTPSYGSYFTMLDNKAEDFQPVLETASRLGADTIRIWPGWVKPEELSPGQLKMIAGTARTVAQAAAGKGIRVAFEFHDNAPTHGAGNTLKVLEAAGHSNLFSYYQVLDPADIEGSVSELRLIYPHLAYIHCHYYIGEDCRPLSEGKELWAAICSALKELGYSGVVCMEFVRGNSPAQLAEDVAVLRELLGK